MHILSKNYAHFSLMEIICGDCIQNSDWKKVIFACISFSIDESIRWLNEINEINELKMKCILCARICRLRHKFLDIMNAFHLVYRSMLLLQSASGQQGTRNECTNWLFFSSIVYTRLQRYIFMWFTRTPNNITEQVISTWGVFTTFSESSIRAISAQIFIATWIEDLHSFRCYFSLSLPKGIT